MFKDKKGGSVAGTRWREGMKKVMRLEQRKSRSHRAWLAIVRIWGLTLHGVGLGHIAGFRAEERYDLPHFVFRFYVKKRW